ncbi:MAG: M1 family peptidase [Chitinophagia bacterium]|nr:M1 family peptidase [Chitinophagia bacterium]
MNRYILLFTALAGIFTLYGCGNNGAQPTANSTQPTDTVQKDTHTQSNADSITLSHLALHIEVNMEAKQIAGRATWLIENHAKAANLQLDIDGLQIDSVDVDYQKSTFTIGEAIPNLGSMLKIPITPSTQSVTIYYKTGANARALQWLTPQQTNDKKQPFLYTQSEAIYARSWIPCADGPGIRYTYSARVKVPKGLLALMSASNPQTKNDSGIYTFFMEQPIPAYLMALAVGDIAFKGIDKRTGVYAEPGMIAKVAYEFGEVNKMVTTAEQLYGPYRWGRYDVIVLPPGFPIGGMENPRLTFCTPTVIAGDRSLVSLIAHELAHSWSGNLVTNATWNDIWLNEGFTVYFERRITEQMMGKPYTDMLWELGYQDLEHEVADKGAQSRDTWLKLDLAKREPDEGLSDIPYEKGAHFLQLVEHTVGRARFDTFLFHYFNGNAFKTMNTEKFMQYLYKDLLHDDSALIKAINPTAWVYGPGIPPNCPRAGNERFARVDSERNKFLSGASPNTLNDQKWTTHEWLHFLRKMPDSLTVKHLTALDGAFAFTKQTNAEIADLWFTLAVAHNYQPAYPAMEAFISRVGRRKFLLPIYEALVKTPEGKQTAQKWFGAYKLNYHPIAQCSIAKLLSK